VADAMERAKAYIAAGVDGIMIHSKSKDATEVLRFAEAYSQLTNKVPLVAVPTTYHSVTIDQLQAAGFNIVIYANHLLRSAYPNMLDTARSILEHNRSEESEKKLLPVGDLIKLIPGNL